jgi:hypothetical protein
VKKANSKTKLTAPIQNPTGIAGLR